MNFISADQLWGQKVTDLDRLRVFHSAAYWIAKDRVYRCGKCKKTGRTVESLLKKICRAQ